MAEETMGIGFDDFLKESQDSLLQEAKKIFEKDFPEKARKTFSKEEIDDYIDFVARYDKRLQKEREQAVQEKLDDLQEEQDHEDLVRSLQHDPLW